MEGKKTQLKVYIPERLDDKFREMVARKYDRIERGLLSREVEVALARHISSNDIQANTQMQSTKVTNRSHFEKDAPPTAVSELKNEIRRYLYETGMTADEYVLRIHNDHLIDAIGRLRGLDKRTIKKWIDLLETFGCIKRAGVKLWEVSDF